MNAEEQKSILLASASPRRQELIAVLGIPFAVAPSHVDETVPDGWGPDQTVSELALRKARHVYESLDSKTNAIVVGSDTVVVRDEDILGKPGDEREALQMILSLQSRSHRVYTGVACIDVITGQTLVQFRSTEVVMKPLSLEEAKAYVRSGEGLDKAGAYGIQGLGASLVTAIDGDYFNVVGLPLSLLADMLAELGLKVLK